MKRVGFFGQVDPGKIDDYKARHAAVWPEMKAALSRAGWHNYSLFLRPDGLLFGYVEVPESLQASTDAMAGEEVNARWQKWMSELFEDSDAAPDQSFVELDEVFHLD